MARKRMNLACMWFVLIGVALMAMVGCKKPEVLTKGGPPPLGPVTMRDKFYDIAANKDTLWVVGYYGKLIRSTDGGKSWVPQQTGTKSSLFGVSFIDDKQGWIVGEAGTILHTKDGGTTWTKQTSPVTSERLLKVFFADEKNGWAVGTYGLILMTSDGGTTWTQSSFKEDVVLNDLAFITNKEGWVAGEYQTILHTKDGGITWTKQRGGMTGKLFGIAFQDKQGIAVGTQGATLATKDGGTTWKEIRNATADTLLKVRFCGSSQLMAVGLRGAVVASEDNGQTWSFVTIPDHYTWLSSLTFTEGKGFFVGNTGSIFAGGPKGDWMRLGMFFKG